ncbi:MAG: hypothetical protein ABIN17_03215 [candidate division WOR-3 bacterium]
MKKFIFFILFQTLLFSKVNLKFGIKSSIVYENGEAYPLIGISLGYYPFSYFFIEGNGEYIMKSSYKEFAFPLTFNFIYKRKYFSPYIGLGLAYHFYSYDSYSDNSLGYRFKGGTSFFDKSGATIYFEAIYDVPDFSKGRGRWQFTGRIDKDFNFEF